VWTLANGLLGCLVAQLAAEGRPVRSSCVYHGAARPPADDCCDGPGDVNGQAWVRVGRAVAQPGGQDRVVTASGTACFTAWRIPVEVGVYRCVATLGDDGEPPDCARVTADAQAAWADARLLRGLAESCSAAEDFPVLPQSWDPLGPMGGCGGSSVTLHLEL
jgi:hypothetical protein